MNFLEEVRIRQKRGDAVRLAELLNTSTTTMSKIFDGTRPLRLDEIKIIADFYGITGYSGDVRRVPVVGLVGAGSEVYPIDDEVDDIEAPPDTTDSAGALLVRGDSMVPAYYDGDMVIYDRPKQWEDLSCYSGEECVVQTVDGRRALKLLLPGPDIRRWTLQSYNAPLWTDVMLEWAAPVVWTRRARRKLTKSHLPQPQISSETNRASKGE